MSKKFPIGQSFQRLTNEPLDETNIFDTLKKAKEYVKDNETSYPGQIIHIKDARTNKEIDTGVEPYEETCYVSSNNMLTPICSFSSKNLNALFSLLYEIIDGPTEDTRDRLDDLYSSMIYGDNVLYKDDEDTLSVDYRVEPWNPNAYTPTQLCLKMTQNTEEDFISNAYTFTSSGSLFDIENIKVQENGTNTFYKIITFHNPPTYLNFSQGKYIEKVIHMCDTSKITDMSRMFEDCKSLKYINMKNWNTSNVENMQNMFDTCTVLSTLNLNNWNVSKVKKFAEMFTNCKALTSLDISNWNTSSAESMYSMFASCIGLTSIDLSGWNTSNVQNMNMMFRYCRRLEKIKGIEDLNTSSLEGAASMFEECYYLKSIDLSKWNVSKLQTANGMFAYCNMTSISLANWNLESIKYLSNLFIYCKKLLYLDLSEFNIGNNLISYDYMMLQCIDLDYTDIVLTGCSDYTIQIITDAHRKVIV